MNWSYSWIRERGTLNISTCLETNVPTSRQQSLVTSSLRFKNLSFGLQMPAGKLLSLLLSSRTFSLLSPLPYSLSLNCIRSPGIFPYLYAAHLIALHENLLQNGQSLNGYCPLSKTVNLTHSHLILTVHSLACDFSDLQNTRFQELGGRMDHMQAVPVR